MTRLPATSRLIALGVALVLCCAPLARAQVLKDSIPELEGVGIIEHRGAVIPRDLAFRDAFGREARSEEWFDGKRPVMLVLAYYNCPLLCTLMLNSVQRSLNELDWTAGREFRVVTLSFDSRNTPAQARLKQETYLAGYAKRPSDDGWTFLVGEVEPIKRLANTVGYHYRFLPESGEFSHPSAIIFLSPDGKVHNYIEKLKFDPREVRLALMEAADGRTGSFFDRIAHRCFPYDPKTGRYTPRVMNIMRVGAVVAAAGLGVFIGVVALARRRVHASPESAGRARARDTEA